VPLTSKAFDTLVVLVENRDRVVTKDELLEAVWHDVIVEEGNLTQQIFLIRRALGDTAQQPRYIVTVPGHGYRFTAGVKEIVPEIASDPVTAKAVHNNTSRPWHVRPVAFVAVGILMLGLGGMWLLRVFRGPAAPVAAMRMVQLTALSGYEIGSVSPDGRQVLFEWTGEGRSDRDIYVQVVGSSDPHPLTTDPADDVAPMWSSDGSQIAYVRRGPDPLSGHVRVMSSLGGSDRKVSDFQVAVPAVWSPDDRSVVAGRAAPPDATYTSNGLYLIPVQGGEPRVITRPPPPGADRTPAFSPDGHHLAYVSCAGPSIRTTCHVNVVDVDSAFAPAGTPRQVTQVPDTTIRGLTWSRDGKTLIYGAEELGVNYLWRAGVDGRRPPERIEVAGAGAVFPSIAPGDRLVFARVVDDDDIYRFEPGRSPQLVARSSVFDGSPQFSPDGRRIAFCSARPGDAVDVWIANADGSEPAQLTHGPGKSQGSPAWSPNGLEIAFESRAADGSWHIWTIDVQSGTQHQVTADLGDQNTPTWSHDGDWLYFSWKLGHASDLWQRDIWRTRVRQKSMEQVTHGGGGFVGHEAADAKTLLYQPGLRTSPVLSQPLDGGAPSTLIACVINTTVAVTESGVYYVPCSAGFAPGEIPIRVMDPGTGKDREVGKLDQYHVGSLRAGFTVSRDGKTILYGRTVNSGADLMMIENFR
jgi:Tol biopolymer transport system component/DNA-binding winged helix-turn-helix (wHTH) protein